MRWCLPLVLFTIVPGRLAFGAEVSWTVSNETAPPCQQVLTVDGTWRCDVRVGVTARSPDSSVHSASFETSTPIIGRDNPAVKVVDIPQNFVKDARGNDFPDELLARMASVEPAMIPYRVSNEVDFSVETDGALIDGDDREPGSVAVGALSGSPFTASAEIKYQVEQGDGQAGGLTSVRPRTVGDFDPFKVMVAWEWKGISVGDGVRRIASFVGYELRVSDEQVRGVYAMALPSSHKVVSGIDAGTALELLGGPAFTVVVNPANRTLMHVLKPGVSETYALPLCPDDLGFATARGRVWITESGEKCVINHQPID